MLDHIDHVAKRFGSDHVAIGTDVAYISRANAIEARKIPARRRSRDRFQNFWPPEARESLAKSNTSLDWINWPLFTVGLVQRGYSDTDIQKILGGNVLRVARAALPAKA
jgi:membrane dipeptidase